MNTCQQQVSCFLPLCLTCCAFRAQPDVQKLAKQAIFSAHRDDVKQCAKRLKEAETIARELLPMINELPGLRHGSFSNSMEEVLASPAHPHEHVDSMQAVLRVGELGE